MNNYQDRYDDINRYIKFFSKGNLYNLTYKQQEYILDNNINANLLYTFDEWKQKGANIYKGSKAIRLPNNYLVFDVTQTNFNFNDDLFIDLDYDYKYIDNTLWYRVCRYIVSECEHHLNTDLDRADYTDILTHILTTRFLNTIPNVESTITDPTSIDIEHLSELNNTLFNVLKVEYNNIRNEVDIRPIRFSDLVKYITDKYELGGELDDYTDDNDINNETEIGLSQGVSTIPVSEDERQWDSAETLEGNGTELHRSMGRYGRGSSGSVEKGQQLETNTEFRLFPDATSQTDGITTSQRDSTGRDSVQEDLVDLVHELQQDDDKSDDDVAFSNYQDFAIEVDNFGYVKISEGTGDNLLYEDKQDGYIDYINYSIYETLDDYNNDIEFDGGMVLLKDYYVSLFKNTNDVVKYLIDTDNLPNNNYKVIDENLDDDIVYSNEQLSLFDSIQTMANLESQVENDIAQQDEVENQAEIQYKNSIDRMTDHSDEFSTTTHIIGSQYIENVQNGIENIPIQNKTFDELTDDERMVVEDDSDLYLSVYNNTVDKGYIITPEMKDFMDKYPYGSQDGIKNPKDIKVLGKWFNPAGSGTWIATEFDGYDDNGDPLLYGCATLGYEWEWGYLPLFSEMKEIDLGARFGHLRIERDRGVNVGDSLYNVLQSTDPSAFNDLYLELPQNDLSEDEIFDYILIKGNNVENSKYRVYRYYQERNSDKDPVHFLQNEYGIGGSSGDFGNNLHSDWHDSKGISAQVYADDSHDFKNVIEYHWKWPQVNKRLKQLIDEGRYFNDEEKQIYDSWLQHQIEYESQYDRLDSLINDYEVMLDGLVNTLPSDEYNIDEDNGNLPKQYYDISDEIDRLKDERSRLSDYYHRINYRSLEKLEESLNRLNSTDNDVVADTTDDDIVIDNVGEADETIVNTMYETIYNDINDDTPDDIEPINYHISDLDIGVGTPLERFNNNIAAIKLLNTLESENRNATPQEQDVLAKYVGWGGLADFFDETKRPEESKQLKDLLTDAEYTSARESTLTSFYTQPIIIDSIYNALDKFGFKKGNILEPSCGIGNFFGRLPENMQDSSIFGVELDRLSSRIAKKLYPNANIFNSGFEKTSFDDNYFDVAIGNVPFGDYSVLDKRYDKYNFKIHDYFFAKTIDKVRPGGVIAFITSKGTMDKLNSKAREYIAQRCDLIGSIRLPDNAFKGAAGTEVVSDIIFLSKRDIPRVNTPDWVISSNSNFMHIDYFNQYMSKDDLKSRITQMLLNKDFDSYNDLIKYCENLRDNREIFGSNWYSLMNIDPSKYEDDENTYRWNNYSRSSVEQKWKNTWRSYINSTYDYNFSYNGNLELYRWYLEDPDEVIRIVANSGKFKKAKTNEEKFELAKEYLTLSDHAIEKNFNNLFVDPVVNLLTDYVDYMDKKTGQYIQPINTYYANNKDMMIGDPSIVTSRFGYDFSTALSGSNDLQQELNNRIDKLDFEYIENQNIQEVELKASKKILPANMNIRNYTYGKINDEIYYRSNSTMELVPSNSQGYTLLNDSINLRDKVINIVNEQLNDISDDNLSILQRELLETYNSYVKKHGRITDNFKKLKPFTDNDSTLSRITTLDSYDKETKKYDISAIFTQRLIHNQEVVVEHCDNSFDALLVSLRSKLKVDLDYMQELTNLPKETIISDLDGVIYRDHENENEYIQASVYLSGNVKQKYNDVKAIYDKTSNEIRSSNDESKLSYLSDKLQYLEKNMNALKDAFPVDLKPYEIDMPLGATWIPIDVYTKFMLDVVLDGNYYSWQKPEIKRSDISHSWFITNKTRVKHSTALTETYGINVKNHNGLDIFESCLNLKREEVAFYVEDENGNKVRVVDKKKTLIAIQKQEKLKRDFVEWVKNNEDIYQRLADIYNNKFNCFVDCKYDKDLINPVGLSMVLNGESVKLYDHQKEAIAKALFGGNCGIFHAVGAGKTLTMIVIAMESKRLGLCNKSLFVVPKNIVGQWGKDFLNAYPNANILVADEKSFSKENRRTLINKIATGNYDAIIISNEQFKLLKLSDERVISYIQEDVEKITNFISEFKYNSGAKWSVKQAESTKKKLLNRIEKRMNMAKDDFIDFEELGIDKLFIDESHNFKNLSFETALSRVKGIGSSADSQRSNDLYYKTKYLNELTNNTGVVFASGTPVANYLAELYTIQRYLQPETLEYMGLNNFDAWVSVFGEIVEEQQLDVTGTKYIPRAVLKKYHNLPELMSCIRSFADIRTQDDLDLKLPNVEKLVIEVPRTDEQKQFLDELNERLDEIRNNKIDPTIDNMLKITTDGRKMALDQRLIGADVQEGEETKADYVANNVYKEYINSNDTKGTQVIFSDLSTPDNSKWNLYQEIKDKLIEKGIPENEIQFIHSFEKDKEKKKLFDDVNKGNVRVIMGSTQKLGTGVNIQQKLIACHHVDVPWKPSDIEQREGRIVRQGNTNDDVRIYRYVTADTFDAYSWQIIENKATFISQIMTNKNPARSCEDLGDENGTVLDAAEIKAIATGNPLIKERMTLENEIAKLNISKQEYNKAKERIKNSINLELPQKIAEIKDDISRIKYDLDKYSLNKPEKIINEFGKEETLLDITINNKHFTDYKEAGEELHSLAKTIKYPDERLSDTYKGRVIGNYKGFDIKIAAGTFLGEIKYLIGDKWNFYINKYEMPKNTIVNLISQLDNLENILSNKQEELTFTEADLEKSKVLVTKPFEFADELKQKEERLAQLIQQMDHGASFTSDSNLEGKTLYDEKGNIISDDTDSVQEFDDEDEYDEYEEGYEIS